MKQVIKRSLRIIRYLLSNHAQERYLESPPVYTTNAATGPKIHLGAGRINLQGWINIDALNLSHIHIIDSGLLLDEFVDGSISVCYLCHVLEHFSVPEGEELLKRIYNKLDSNGEVLISVPNFDVLVDKYIAEDRDLASIVQALSGGQDYDYNIHKSFYTYNALSQLIAKVGFRYIKQWGTIEEFGLDINDWSNKYIVVAGEKKPISINLKAIK